MFQSIKTKQHKCINNQIKSFSQFAVMCFLTNSCGTVLIGELTGGRIDNTYEHKQLLPSLILKVQIISVFKNEGLGVIIARRRRKRQMSL